MTAKRTIRRTLRGLLIAIPLLLFAHDFTMAAHEGTHQTTAAGASHAVHEAAAEHAHRIQTSHHSAPPDEQPVHCPDSECPAMEQCGIDRVLRPGIPHLDTALHTVQPLLDLSAVSPTSCATAPDQIRSEPGREILARIQILTI